jgi:hypothetical protein
MAPPVVEISFIYAVVNLKREGQRLSIIITGLWFKFIFMQHVPEITQSNNLYSAWAH